MKRKPKLKTVSAYRKWKAAKYALLSGVFVCPTLPAAIVTIINWQEWFQKSSASVPFGFASMMVAVIAAIVGVLKSDTVFKKADIAVFWLAGIFMCVGISCMFLASLFTQMGMMWLFVGSGLLGSGACYVSERRAVEPKISLYKQLIEDNCLDDKARRAKAAEKQARKDAEADAKIQAVD